MGCGATGNRGDRLDEFFLEAFGFKKKEQKGLNIDNTDETKTLVEVGSSDLIFNEEIMTHGDESGVIKPWLEGMLSPEFPLEEDLTPPKYSLKIEHVFGFRTEDSRKNLYFLSNYQILYSTSSLGIIQNLDDNTQTLFGGFPLGENKECHDKDITAIAYLKKDVSMVATGQLGLNPKILVWSPVDPEVIYAKFEQPKGSQLVSSLSFDRTGRFIGSFGKDENDSFYIFDLKTKEIYWESATKAGNEEEYLLDICFNPEINELCLVGVEKVIFANYINRQLFKKSNKPGKTKKIYTSCCYVNKNICLVGNNKGKIYKFEDNNKYHSRYLSKGTIQNITYKRQNNKAYISDSLCYVFICDPESLDSLDKFEMNSIVRSLDVSRDNKIIMGLKNGEIKIKYYGEKTKHEQSLIKSHSDGQINDLIYIPEKKILSIGDDNKILLYNLLSKKCESSGLISPPFVNIIGKCLSYNESKENIAIGLSNGNISIRKDQKHLDTKIQADIKVSDKSLVILKYTDYGDYLLCSSEANEICLLDVNDNYNILKKIEVDSCIYNFDWDREGKYIQAANRNNKFVFFRIDKDSMVPEVAEHMQSVEWPKITCKFNYAVQGIFQGSTNPDFISSVSKANTKNLICAGDEHYLLHLCNYPCVSDNPKKKKYRGHSGKIKVILWNIDDTKIVTIAENDLSIIYWTLNENSATEQEEEIKL
jgi:microtubule-associated protein-like 6